jgi:ABC-type multidrug transport system ATPase subunit
MLTASSGDALIDGRSVVNEIGDIRKNMGVCPQEDILFPELTGQQHLYLMGSIRGIPRRELKVIVEEKLHQVKLYKVCCSLIILMKLVQRSSRCHLLWRYEA